MTGDVISEDELEEFPIGIDGYSDMKELAKSISKKSFDFIWRLIFLVGTKLSEVAIKDYNAGKEKLGSELINVSMSLISLGRKMQKNMPKNIKNKASNELLSLTSGYFDVEELATAISKLSYNSIGKLMFFIGNELNRLMFVKGSVNEEENFNTKSLELGTSLENVGRVLKVKIWNDICKKYSKEI